MKQRLRWKRSSRSHGPPSRALGQNAPPVRNAALNRAANVPRALAHAPIVARAKMQPLWLKVKLRQLRGPQRLSLSPARAAKVVGIRATNRETAKVRVGLIVSRARKMVAAKTVMAANPTPSPSAALKPARRALKSPSTQTIPSLFWQRLSCKSDWRGRGQRLPPLTAQN